MNVFHGEINELNTDQHLTIVGVQVGELSFKAIVVESATSAPYLELGHKVDVAFKETEAIIVTGDVSGISLRNRIPGTIESIDSNNLLSRLEITTEIGKVASIITSNAVEDLGLKPLAKVTVMIKTNEMILLHD